MRIFILGVGATGSLLAHLLARQGHIVTCGDRDVERARRFLGKKSRAAVITAGVSPGLMNLLAKRGAEMLDSVEAIHIRLYESSQSDDPVSQWSPEESFNEATSRPRVYRAGRFHLGKRL